MPEPTLILHVGPHKTGSTVLQYMLLRSRDYLAEHGYEYPIFGMSQFAQHRINSFLNGNLPDAQDVTEESMRGLAARGANIILSSEDFIYLSVEKLQRLKILLNGFRIQIVLFVRTPVDLWPSHWQELVKHGRDETLIEYLGAYYGLTTAIDARFMHPVSQSNRFAHVFGRDNLRLFCYDNVVADGVDLFDFFVDRVLHLPPRAHPQPSVVINPSLRPDMVEMLRCLNDRFRHGTGQHPRSRIISGYQLVQKEVEADPRYAAFQTAFEKHARTIKLDSDNDIFRNRERLLLNNFGDRIENKVSADKVFAQDYHRSIIYGARYWADRFGFGEFIDQVLAQLKLTPA